MTKTMTETKPLIVQPKLKLLPELTDYKGKQTTIGGVKWSTIRGGGGYFVAFMA